MRFLSDHPGVGAASDEVAGLVVFVGCDAARPGELPWRARAAVEAADVVLYDRNVAAATLALVPSRCFAEPVAGEPGSGTAVARARSLAGDGWRVVRLV